MSLRQAMDRLFDDDYRPFRWLRRARRACPAARRHDRRDALTIEAALPGVKPEDVEITVQNGTLTISGKTATSGPPTRAATSSRRSGAGASAAR